MYDTISYCTSIPSLFGGELPIENNFPVEFYKHGSTFSGDPVFGKSGDTLMKAIIPYCLYLELPDSMII